LRCVLAPGLDRAECQAEPFPHRIRRRFTRALALIDRAETETIPKRARSKLRRVARLLGKTAAGVEHVGARRPAAMDCVVALSAMLDEGERRSMELATSF
jgi:hypothetical protein